MWKYSKPLYNRWDPNIFGFYKFWEFFLQSIGVNTFSKNTPKTTKCFATSKPHSEMVASIVEATPYMRHEVQQVMGTLNPKPCFPVPGSVARVREWSHWIRLGLRDVLKYLCVWSPEVVFHGHQINFWRFCGQPSGDIIYSTPPL